ncbi:hypothetical protein T484DRAFT_3017068 [Baffinella frigidus]|nr:hypothetical protein T484DRAFT_3017068 [Cryptophyta sp. CCMP2293]
MGKADRYILGPFDPSRAPLGMASGLGPGAHNVTDDQEEGRGVTFPRAEQRPRSAQEAFAAGVPGAIYATPSSLDTSRGLGWGTASSKDAALLEPSTTPGPGTYHVDGLTNRGRESSMEVAMGSGSRLDLSAREAQQKPGPGAYEVRNLIAAGGRLFSSATSLGIGEQHPLDPSIKATSTFSGPGRYDPSGAIGEDPARGFSLLGRLEGHVTRATTPGPQYEVSGVYAQGGVARTPQVTFGSGARLPGEAEQQGPGPAAYDVQGIYRYGAEDREAGTSFQGAGTRDDHSAGGAETPGPGAYEVRGKVADGNRPGGAATSMGYGDRFRALLLDEGGAGPAAYTLPSTLDSRAASFERTSGHPGAVAAAFGPGPADYDLPSTLSRSGPIVLPDYNTPSGATHPATPGPADYDLTGLTNRGSVRMEDARSTNLSTGGGRLREARAADSPGPASYLLPSAPLPPGGRMGPPPERREWEEEEERGGPGPGAYDASEAQGRIGPNMRGGSLGASGERFRDPSFVVGEGGGTPGPGAYDLSRTGAIRIGGGPMFGTEDRRGEEGRAGGPGVGEYNLPTLDAGRSHAFPSTRIVAGSQFASGQARPEDPHEAARHALPGPADYLIQPRDLAPSWTIPHEDRWMATGVNQDPSVRREQFNYPGNPP